MRLHANIHLFVIALAAVAALVGCADDAGAPDGGLGGSTDGGRDGGLLVTPPDIPWLAAMEPPLMLAPCPDGWREVHGGTVTECDPYPAGGAESCNAGETHFPGEPGCRPIGDACPMSAFATSLLGSGTVVYVKAGAAAGGDGSLAGPFAALAEVPWVSLVAPVTVALGKGTYTGTLPLKAGVRVVGACVEETVVTGVAAPVRSVVAVTGGGEPAVVENLSIRGAPQHGVVVEGGRALRLRGVLVDGVRDTGIVVEGSGAAVALVDVVVRGTEGTGVGILSSGMGVVVQGGASLTATRLIAAENRGLGVHANGEGTAMMLTDTVVRDTQPRTVDRAFGQGLNVQFGVTLEAARLLVIGNHETGVLVAGTGTAVSMTDAVIRDTESRVIDGTVGRGLTVQDGAELAATRLLVAENRELGVLIRGGDTRAAFTDVVVRDTRPRAQGEAGFGMHVDLGARCDATRVLVSGNTEVGISVTDVDTFMVVTDVLVQDTATATEPEPEPEPEPGPNQSGFGVAVQNGARYEASRFVIANNRAVSIAATGEGTAVELFDTVVSDTQAETIRSNFGRGIQAQSGASLVGTRVRVMRSLQIGVIAFTGATIALSDTLVQDVEVGACVSGSCPAAPFGYGAGAYAAALSLRRFRVASAVTCGVMVAPVPGHGTASLDLEDGVVSESEIGACVQVDGYDLDRLTNDVEYRDNETNLDATMLPLPYGTVPIEL